MNVLECSVKNPPKTFLKANPPKFQRMDIMQRPNALLYGICATPAGSLSGLQFEEGGLQPEAAHRFSFFPFLFFAIALTNVA